MEVVYDPAVLRQYCDRDPRDVDWVASFCTASPDNIYIQPNHESYPEYYGNERYMDTIRHEIAHRIVLDRCGTTAPPIAGDRYEGTTNSYAVLYLGAGRDRLQNRDPESEY